MTQGSSGNGNGTVVITAIGNGSTDARTAQVSADVASASVKQDGLVPNNCGADAYQITPSSRSAPSGGTTFVVSLTATVGCAWTTTSGVSWMSIEDRGPGFNVPSVTSTGNAQLVVTISANTAPNVRTGAATIAGRTLTVTQDGAATTACSYRLNSDVLNFSAAGGTGALSVTTTDNCSWWVDRTNTTEDFVSVSSAHTSGSGSRTFTVRPNFTTSSLSGRLAVYGDSGNTQQPFAFFTVNQSGAGCLYTVTPEAASYGATGGLGSFRVTTSPSDCSWTASASSFVVLTGVASGTGAATVTYQVNANAGSSRSGSVTIAGLSGLNPPRMHQITQSGSTLGAR